LQSISTHGANIPVIGYGTWNLPGEPCTQGVARALEVGYRHIDTAAGYKNEDRVGEGIRASGVPRDDIFLTTKVGPENLEESAFKRSAENSLKLLGVDQVDLLLIHWPSKTLSVAETIKTLNEAKKMGWTRHIGVSNFTTKLLAEAWEATEAPLVTNQCEYHPYLNQDKLLAACRAKGMAFTAFSPLARMEVLEDPVIVGIAGKHDRTAAQVVLRWGIQHEGVVVIPKSANPERIKSNLEIFDFALDDDEMTAISTLRSRKHRGSSPASVAPEWDE
jgi:diketogulonate reductase-like aldo/keto reductase